MADKDDLEKHPPIKDGDPVPRVPRQRGWGFSKGDLFRIAMFAALLFAVLALRKPCSEGVGSFVNTFEAPIDAGAAVTAPPPLPEGELIEIGVDDDPEEVRRKIEAIRSGGDAGVPTDAE